MQMPIVRLDVCELTALRSKLNYSLLDHVLLERELEFLLPNGTEVFRHDVLNRSDVHQVSVLGMSCLQVPSMQVCSLHMAVAKPTPPEGLPPPSVIPDPHHPLWIAYVLVHEKEDKKPEEEKLGGDDYESILPYHRWFLRLQGPIHPDLQKNNFSYVNGLFIRPSLANATHPVSIREETFLKTFVPFMAKNRTVIIRSLVAFDHWTDSLGGRRGAPYPDTFFLDDSRIVPEQSENDLLKVAKFPEMGNFMKIVLPVPTSLVRVHLHLNDIVNDIVALLGQLASGILIFGLLTMMFPAIREEKRHFFVHLDSYHLGTPGELDPLLGESTVDQPENCRSQDEEQGP
eukprot:symbB.v1.2.001798.t1/scaffold97.1/size333048/2